MSTPGDYYILNPLHEGYPNTRASFRISLLESERSILTDVNLSVVDSSPASYFDLAENKKRTETELRPVIPSAMATCLLNKLGNHDPNNLLKRVKTNYRSGADNLGDDVYEFERLEDEYNLGENGSGDTIVADRFTMREVERHLRYIAIYRGNFLKDRDKILREKGEDGINFDLHFSQGRYYTYYYDNIFSENSVGPGNVDYIYRNAWLETANPLFNYDNGASNSLLETGVRPSYSEDRGIINKIFGLIQSEVPDSDDGREEIRVINIGNESLPAGGNINVYDGDIIIKGYKTPPSVKMQTAASYVEIDNVSSLFSLSDHQEGSDDNTDNVMGYRTVEHIEEYNNPAISYSEFIKYHFQSQDSELPAIDMWNDRYLSYITEDNKFVLPFPCAIIPIPQYMNSRIYHPFNHSKVSNNCSSHIKSIVDSIESFGSDDRSKPASVFINEQCELYFGEKRWLYESGQDIWTCWNNPMTLLLNINEPDAVNYLPYSYTYPRSNDKHRRIVYASLTKEGSPINNAYDTRMFFTDTKMYGVRYKKQLSQRSSRKDYVYPLFYKTRPETIEAPLNEVSQIGPYELQRYWGTDVARGEHTTVGEVLTKLAGNEISDTLKDSNGGFHPSEALRVLFNMIVGATVDDYDGSISGIDYHYPGISDIIYKRVPPTQINDGVTSRSIGPLSSTVYNKYMNLYGREHQIFAFEKIEGDNHTYESYEEIYKRYIDDDSYYYPLTIHDPFNGGLLKHLSDALSCAISEMRNYLDIKINNFKKAYDSVIVRILANMPTVFYNLEGAGIDHEWYSTETNSSISKQERIRRHLELLNRVVGNLMYILRTEDIYSDMDIDEIRDIELEMIESPTDEYLLLLDGILTRGATTSEIIIAKGTSDYTPIRVGDEQIDYDTISVLPDGSPNTNIGKIIIPEDQDEDGYLADLALSYWDAISPFEITTNKYRPKTYNGQELRINNIDRAELQNHLSDFRSYINDYDNIITKLNFILDFNDTYSSESQPSQFYLGLFPLGGEITIPTIDGDKIIEADDIYNSYLLDYSIIEGDIIIDSNGVITGQKFYIGVRTRENQLKKVEIKANDDTYEKIIKNGIPINMVYSGSGDIIAITWKDARLNISETLSIIESGTELLNTVIRSAYEHRDSFTEKYGSINYDKLRELVSEYLYNMFFTTSNSGPNYVSNISERYSNRGTFRDVGELSDETNITKHDSNSTDEAIGEFIDEYLNGVIYYNYEDENGTYPNKSNEYEIRGTNATIPGIEGRFGAFVEDLRDQILRKIGFFNNHFRDDIVRKVKEAISEIDNGLTEFRNDFMELYDNGSNMVIINKRSLFDSFGSIINFINNLLRLKFEDGEYSFIDIEQMISLDALRQTHNSLQKTMIDITIDNPDPQREAIQNFQSEILETDFDEIIGIDSYSIPDNDRRDKIISSFAQCVSIVELIREILIRIYQYSEYGHGTHLNGKYVHRSSDDVAFSQIELPGFYHFKKMEGDSLTPIYPRLPVHYLNENDATGHAYMSYITDSGGHRKLMSELRNPQELTFLYDQFIYTQRITPLFVPEDAPFYDMSYNIPGAKFQQAVPDIEIEPTTDLSQVISLTNLNSNAISVDSAGASSILLMPSRTNDDHDLLFSQKLSETVEKMQYQNVFAENRIQLPDIYAHLIGTSTVPCVGPRRTKYYRCVSAHTSENRYDLDRDHLWIQLNYPPDNIPPTWRIGAVYNQGDLVRRDKASIFCSDLLIKVATSANQHPNLLQPNPDVPGLDTDETPIIDSIFNEDIGKSASQINLRADRLNGLQANWKLQATDYVTWKSWSFDTNIQPGSEVDILDIKPTTAPIEIPVPDLEITGDTDEDEIEVVTTPHEPPSVTLDYEEQLRIKSITLEERPPVTFNIEIDLNLTSSAYHIDEWVLMKDLVGKTGKEIKGIGGARSDLNRRTHILLKDSLTDAVSKIVMGTAANHGILADVIDSISRSSGYEKVLVVGGFADAQPPTQLLNKDTDYKQETRNRFLALLRAFHFRRVLTGEDAETFFYTEGEHVENLNSTADDNLEKLPIKGVTEESIRYQFCPFSLYYGRTDDYTVTTLDVTSQMENTSDIKEVEGESNLYIRPRQHNNIDSGAGAYGLIGILRSLVTEINPFQCGFINGFNGLVPSLILKEGDDYYLYSYQEKTFDNSSYDVFTKILPGDYIIIGNDSDGSYNSKPIIKYIIPVKTGESNVDDRTFDIFLTFININTTHVEGKPNYAIYYPESIPNGNPKQQDFAEAIRKALGANDSMTNLKINAIVSKLNKNYNNAISTTQRIDKWNTNGSVVRLDGNGVAINKYYHYPVFDSFVQNIDHYVIYSMIVDGNTKYFILKLRQEYETSGTSGTERKLIFRIAIYEPPVENVEDLLSNTEATDHFITKPKLASDIESLLRNIPGTGEYHFERSILLSDIMISAGASCPRDAYADLNDMYNKQSWDRRKENKGTSGTPDTSFHYPFTHKLHESAHVFGFPTSTNEIIGTKIPYSQFPKKGGRIAAQRHDIILHNLLYKETGKDNIDYISILNVPFHCIKGLWQYSDNIYSKSSTSGGYSSSSTEIDAITGNQGSLFMDSTLSTSRVGNKYINIGRITEDKTKEALWERYWLPTYNQDVLTNRYASVICFDRLMNSSDLYCGIKGESSRFFSKHILYKIHESANFLDAIEVEDDSYQVYYPVMFKYSDVIKSLGDKIADKSEKKHTTLTGAYGFLRAENTVVCKDVLFDNSKTQIANTPTNNLYNSGGEVYIRDEIVDLIYSKTTDKYIPKLDGLVENEDRGTILTTKRETEENNYELELYGKYTCEYSGLCFHTGRID